jgi:hypothetical protein
MLSGAGLHPVQRTAAALYHVTKPPAIVMTWQDEQEPLRWS